MASHIRPPAVAGRFYPKDAAQLGMLVEALLAGTSVSSPAPPIASRPSTIGIAPKGLIAPHAGYVYSGPIAATAYASVRTRATQITKVVLLGPAHRVYVDGLALPAAERFATPLGEVEIDSTLAAAVLALPQVCRSEQAHALEHSLEVHVPFLQALLARFTLLPLLVGDASPAQVAEVLELVWGGPETLVVISSDLSHYHDYAEACRLDEATANWIACADTPGLDPRRACGARCIDGLIQYGRCHPIRLELLDLRNSGDTAGPRDQVVGYGAFAIREGGLS